MNILYFIQTFYPSVFGGGEYIFFLLSKGMSHRGHDVHVITERVKGLKSFEMVEGIKIHRIGSEHLPTLRPSVKRNIDYLVNGIRKSREIINAKKRRGEGVHIVHSSTYFGTFVGHLCSKIYKIPHIATIHDVYQASSQDFWREWMTNEIENAPFYAATVARLVERWTMKLNVSAFLTPSLATKNDLISFGVRDARIVVIPHGLDPSRYNSSQNSIITGNHTGSKLPQSAIFIGRLIAYKNVQTVIRAFRKVLQNIPNTRLVIVGSGPFKESLMKEAESIVDNVEFTGSVTEEAKIELLKRSSFMVFPSLLEGFGISVIEGFACGKPVLVSDVQPLSDIVVNNQTGRIIPPFDVDGWAREMVHLFADAQSRQQMGEKAYREFVSKYDSKIMVSEVEKVYESLIHSTNHVSAL